MVTCDTWDGEAGDRCEEDDLTEDADLCEDELQLLAPLDPRPSRISLRALLTCSHCEYYLSYRARIHAGY